MEKVINPTLLLCSFVDEEEPVYVSDYNYHRVKKWMRGGKEDVVVADENREDDSLRQLFHPQEVLTDQLGDFYMADGYNDRVMRW